MRLKKSLFDISNGSRTEVIFDTPDKCPDCKHAIEPIFINGCVDEKGIAVQYYCNACKRSFLSRYQFDCLHDQFHIIGSYPNNPISRDFPVEIMQVSPKFCEIYNQAYSAERLGLSEICGLGYRKALEFLVKDFCILTHPDCSEKIKSDHRVDNVIRKYLSSYPYISDISRVSFWFGNDETHYTRQYDSDNLNNLKKYIEAIIHCIQTELIYGDASDLLAQKYGHK